MIYRRSFVGGLLGGLLAAPAIIRTSGLLMPIKPAHTGMSRIDVPLPSDLRDGSAVTLQISDDGQSWADLRSFSMVGGVLTMDQPMQAGRFYRVSFASLPALATLN